MDLSKSKQQESPSKLPNKSKEEKALAIKKKLSTDLSDDEDYDFNNEEDLNKFIHKYESALSSQNSPKPEKSAVMDR